MALTSVKATVVKTCMKHYHYGCIDVISRWNCENGASPSAALLRMATGAWVAQAIYVAAKFGVADSLVAGPKSAAELAEITARMRARSVAYYGRWPA
jgi:hypothetical protein